MLVAFLLAAAAVRHEPTVPLHDPATSSWVREERADPADSVTLTVALKVEAEALARLEAVFWAVSTPGHADYGKHLTNQQVRSPLSEPVRPRAPPEQQALCVVHPQWSPYHPVVAERPSLGNSSRSQANARQSGSLPPTPPRPTAQVTRLLDVSDERVSAVTAHFSAAGAQVVLAPHRDTLTVTMPVGAAEALLSTQLHWFRHSRVPSAPRLLRSATGYALHESVSPHVHLVGELLQFPHVRDASLVAGEPALAQPPARLDAPAASFHPLSAPADPDWPAGCDALVCAHYVTPATLAARYKLPADPLPVSPGNSMAVAEFQGQYYKLSDLSSFGDSCHVPDVSINSTIGGDLPVAGVESELDIEYIKAVAPSVPLTVVYNSEYSLLGWFTQVGAGRSPTLSSLASQGLDRPCTVIPFRPLSRRRALTQQGIAQPPPPLAHMHGAGVAILLTTPPINAPAIS
jgi:hypothetical protein